MNKPDNKIAAKANKNAGLFHYIAKSGFVRSVFFRVLSIFVIVSIAIAAVAFFSFTSEIRKNVLTDRQMQLNAIEDTISKRMDEIASIAYNIGIDPAFYLEPIDGQLSSGYEMSSTLARYLVGNSFIEHLAYYRLAEPDTLYISSGERSLSEFFTSSFGLSPEAAQENIQQIQEAKETQVRLISYGEGQQAFFSYLYPLPQLSKNPRAFVLMLIPVAEVEPLLEPLLATPNSQVAVFDAAGQEIYRLGGEALKIPLDDFVQDGSTAEGSVRVDGTDYILQKAVSPDNGWVYVSAIRQSDTLPGMANKQLVFIILMLALLFIAVIAMLASIVKQYRPISNLAATVAGPGADGQEQNSLIDESVLLTSTIATLQGDSEQKQKFETAYHEAEAASKAKSAFLSNMSHDIRTPMNAVVGMTALALKHADDPAYVQECLQKVQVSSHYLMDIINNVLDMSRIESGRFSLSKEIVDLPALIEALVALIGPSAAAKSQQLSADVGELRDRTVLGDNVRLTQVFVNILSNAVKFTPEGGSIRLTVRQTDSDEPQYGQYRFTFTDTGRGMSPEFVSQVFDTFSRDKGVDMAKVEGTGLGMAIAKNLVELMGGTITCQSELGKGTIFTVTMRLPIAAATATGLPVNSMQVQEDANWTVDLRGVRILLVDDNAINRELAHKILSETNAEVVEAQNGQEAVEAFASRPDGYFDIILMDIQMPVMNGYAATAAIRALAKADAPTIPIYAMTANTFDEDVRQVKDAGMNGHIGKPYTPVMLYKLLAQALHK